MTYQQQYYTEHNQATKKQMVPAHMAALKGLGHHSLMPASVTQAMAYHARSSHTGDGFRKRRARENFTGITSAVHPTHPNTQLKIPSVISSVNHPCPVGQKAQTWGSIAAAKNPACASKSPSYGKFHSEGNRQHGAHQYQDLYYSHNLKNKGGDGFRRRERMHHRGSKDDYFMMGRLL